MSNIESPTEKTTLPTVMVSLPLVRTSVRRRLNDEQARYIIDMVNQSRIQGKALLFRYEDFCKWIGIPADKIPTNSLKLYFTSVARDYNAKFRVMINKSSNTYTTPDTEIILVAIDI